MPVANQEAGAHFYEGKMDLVEVALRKWASDAQRSLVEYSECFKPFHAEPGRLPEETDFTLGQLHFRATCTSDTAIFLTAHSKWWDADVLLRSVMEATLKFVFICAAEGEEQGRRVDEYLNVLPAIARLKRHRRARECLATVKDAEGKEWRPVREHLLPDDEVLAISEKYPKDLRSRLEGKWGFTQIAESLAKSGERFRGVAALLHTYGIWSHSVHLDGDAVLTMWEREHRSPEREQAIGLAHGARNIGHVMHFAQARALAACTARNLDKSPVQDVARRYEPLHTELLSAYELWHDVEYAA